MYFRGQGIVEIGTRNANTGAAGVFRDVGNVPELVISLDADVLEHQESRTGQGLTDFRLTRKKKATMKCALEAWDKANLADALYGTAATVAGGTVTDEAFPTGIVVEDIVRTAHPDISSPVITDSSGTPKTLTVGTNYKILSAKHGSIQFLDLTTGGGYVQPFLIDYAYGATTNIAMFTQGAPERWLRFRGMNTADTGNPNNPVLIELYRVMLDPIKDLGMIQDDLFKMELNGSVLYDETKDGDTYLGQFGRIVLID